MEWIDVGSPTPRSKAQRYTQFQWPQGEERRLLKTLAAPERTFSEVIEKRTTRRAFGKLDIAQLSTLLHLSSRVKEWGNDDLGFQITKRPVASAGAIHPIHLLVSLDRNSDWLKYDPHEHLLNEIRDSRKILDGLLPLASTVLPLQEGTLIQLVAEPGMTFAKYENACSLIWRDVGALIAQLGLVAEYLGLNFCPLGITGEPFVSNLDARGRLAGVGMVIVGSSP